MQCLYHFKSTATDVKAPALQIYRKEGMDNV